VLPRFAFLQDDLFVSVPEGEVVAPFENLHQWLLRILAHPYRRRISFDPTRIAKDLRFKLTVRGCRLMVDIREDTITYRPCSPARQPSSKAPRMPR
jgi:hypothetical protein